MTIHKSKGLEFDYVFANMDNEICPKMNNFTNYQSLEEDVRLAYVAITRAKKQIYLGFQTLDTISPFVAKSNVTIEPIHGANLTLPDVETEKNTVKEFLKLLDCYYFLNEEGIYELRNNEEVVGYRYQTMIKGTRVYLQVDLDDVKKAGICVEDVSGTAEVTLENGRVKSYEEINGTVPVYNVTDAGLVTELFVNQNPLRTLRHYIK